MAEIIQLFQSGNTERKEHMDVAAFRLDIIRPALKATNLWSDSAENLLLGTAIAESSLEVVKQIGGGPALSFFQIEPGTYNDCLRYLSTPRARKMKEVILSALFMDIFPSPECLTWNIRLSVLIARIKYWMHPDPLPRHDDPVKMAEYWKRHYNTEKGRGTTEHFISQWGHFNVN